jgi:3-phenylpropionate/trans-cinnamate dioxygenase ferredoxin reductase subunit
MVAAIGVEPDTRLASAAGLATDDGILVDLMLRTADPDVFAAGDCARVRHADGSCRRYETWQNAQVQGEIAGKNMAGLDEPLCEPAWFWSDQYDLGLQGVGDTSGTAASIRTLDDRTDVLFFLGEDQRMIGAAGLGPGNAVARDIKVAQRLIAAGTRIDANLLGDPQQSLKKLLKAA